MIQVIYDRNKFQEAVKELLGRTQNPEGLLQVMGRELANQFKAHFRKKEQTDVNKLAPERRTHFWLAVSRTVSAPAVQGRQVSVSVNHPAIAQKVFGGPITAKRVRNLSIPIAPDAYGRTPATFERETGLKLFVLRKGGRALLAAAKAGGVEVEYLLTPRVKQQPDPTALPLETELEDALIRRGQAAVDRQTG